MKNIVTHPCLETVVKTALFQCGTIRVFPDTTRKDFELSLDTIKTLFGERAIITNDQYNGHPCLYISNADFFVVDSKTINPDFILEMKEV